MQVTWAYSKHHNKKTTKFITVTFRSSSVLCTLFHYNSLIKYLITFPELFYFNIRMIRIIIKYTGKILDNYYSVQKMHIMT